MSKLIKICENGHPALPATVTMNASSEKVQRFRVQSLWQEANAAEAIVEDADARGRYENIVDDPKYQHFARIPGRIIRCLDYFGIACERVAVWQRLSAYYLFIGVVDQEIDSGQIETGRIVLQRVTKRHPCFDQSTRISNVSLLTEILKCHISDDIYPVMLSHLRELYQEVIRERMATSIDSYIAQRKTVGRLTARLSYLLIRPLLNGRHETFGEFMERVGEVGCLIDSIIDLNADQRFGLLSFRPTPTDFLRLTFCTSRAGVKLSLAHPRLCGLFLQAINDNVRDRFRVRQRSPTEPWIGYRYNPE